MVIKVSDSSRFFSINVSLISEMGHPFYNSFSGSQLVQQGSFPSLASLDYEKEEGGGAVRMVRNFPLYRSSILNQFRRCVGGNIILVGTMKIKNINGSNLFNLFKFSTKIVLLPTTIGGDIFPAKLILNI